MMNKTMIKEKLAKLAATLRVTVAIGVFALTGVMQTTSQAYAMTNSEVTSIMDSLRGQLEGKYWNGGKTGKGDILLAVTNSPCKGKEGKECASNRYVYGSVNGRQCTGFAHSYAYYIFGSEFTTWETRSDVTQVEPGDVIHVDGHEAIVWKVSGSEVKVAECWGSSKCKIAYGYFNGNSKNKTMSNIKKNFSGLKVYKHPGSGNENSKNKAPSISVKSIAAPTGNLKKGSNFGLRGIIGTNYGTLTEVTGYVFDSKGRVVSGYAKSYYPNTPTMDLRYTINNDFSFGKLGKGNYKYVIVATAKNGKLTTTTEIIRTEFTIK